MDKLQLKGQNLGRVFNFGNGRVHAVHFLCFVSKLPNLKLKARPGQLLGSLPLDIALAGSSKSGANVIKLFTAVIYLHSMVILSFCVIKLNYPGNYRRIAVNYHSILTLEKEGLEVLR